MKLVIFTTGGTIDKVYFDAKSQYQVGEPVVPAILKGANIVTPFEVQPIFQKDSLDLTDEDRQTIKRAVQKSDGTHCLVTHGTDTIVETAKCLSQIKDKVIVLTGSLQPASFKGTDADFNLGCAIGVLLASPGGTYIVMNGAIFDPFNVRKNLTTNQFERVS